MLHINNLHYFQLPVNINVHMKKLLAIVVGMLLFGVSGCSSVAKLPSVTVGGKANRDALVGLNVSKKGVSATVPLVNVDVPLPTVELNKD